MRRFKTKNDTREAKISTASMPDIVFLLLFFFMVSATIKANDNMVYTEIPNAINLNKAEEKTLLRTLKVGKSKNKMHGSTVVISDGKRILNLEQLGTWVHEMKNELPEYQRAQMTIILQCDQKVKMGLVGDIQQKLRAANARKIIYKATPVANE
ncbi:MAG: biopolymer transporter ExbD [Reichenbachiella sp.]